MYKLIGVTVSIALCGVFSAAQAGTSQNLQTQARITLPQATKTALKVYPGKVVSEELEAENGGSGLRYSFDIKSGAITHEVGVDAKSGRVLENSVDNDKD